jgi:tetratricopeptide (TPR) repeat protein
LQTKLLLLALFGIIGGCSKPDPNATPVIYNDGEYNQRLKEVAKVSEPIVQKFYEGELLTDGEKETMKQAKRTWQALSVYNPTKYSVYFGAGQAAFLTEEYSDAIRYLNSAVTYAPQKPTEEDTKIIAEAFDLISRASFFIGRFDQAEVAAKEAIKRAPGVVTYMHSQAQALGQMGRTKEAVAILNEALTIEPDNTRCQTLLRFLNQPIKPVERP